MSSGACHALVALLLTLTATVGLALPAAAEDEGLNESSSVIYTVDPNNGSVDVEILINLIGRNRNKKVAPGNWGPIVVEETANPRVNNPYKILNNRTEDLPGPWKAIYISHPAIESESNPGPLQVSYKLDASIDSLSSGQRDQTPARVNDGYIYACVPGQWTDSGSTQLRIKNGARFEPVDQSGSTLATNDQGFVSGSVQDPRDLFTCVEGTRDDRLTEIPFPGPDDRSMILQPWPGDDGAGWAASTSFNGEPMLDAIREHLGLAIPGQGPVIIRQAPTRQIGGYASAHDTPGIVQVDEDGGVPKPGQGFSYGPEHEFAHAWFGKDNFQELWLREGLAAWTASSLLDATCEPVDSNTSEVELADWKVVKPFANANTIEAQIDAQQRASCGIMSAVAARMSPEQWRVVLGSMLNGETKYIGSDGPGAATGTTVNYQEWLDAVDERGLVPAAKADPAFAANLEDLDFAQNLLDDFGVDFGDGGPALLVARSEARARYHQFLDDSPLGAPLWVRESMDDWEFRNANQALDKSIEILDDLREAEALVPGTGLIPYVQAGFEGARNEAELDAVFAQTQTLLNAANEVREPLAQLTAASPDGWSLPVVINSAIESAGDSEDFAAIQSAIPPALSAVQAISTANDFLPQAGLLDTYRTRYESSASTAQLETLAEEVAVVGRDAERTAAALDELNAAVGDWRIPAAVTDPIQNGQLAAGFGVVSDARAVVKAAAEADIALLDTGAEVGSAIRERFEAVQTAPEMADLKAETEQQRDEAVAIGGVLATLKSRVPDWKIPAVIDKPINERRFAEAATAAATAQAWIEDAADADDKLPELDALNRARDDFESAETLADLKAGASTAAKSLNAAGTVAQAREAYVAERDLMADLGLWGIDVKPTLDEAVQAARAGEVEIALSRSGAVLDILQSASSSGGLRLAGIVFLGVAILGVAGLWLMLRREAGPPWARQTKPHWIDDDKKKAPRLGRGKSDKNKKGK